MESEKDHIPESVKVQVRKAMDKVREIMGKEEDLPPHVVGLKEYHRFFHKHIEVFATQIYSKAEEMYVQGLAERPNPENDGSKNTQPQKTHGVNVVRPTHATSTIEKPEETGISRCGPEITKEIATTEQQRFIAEEVGCFLSDKQKPEEAGISRCGPEITKEIATTEQQRLIVEEGPKMNEEMLPPNAVEPDSGLCLKNQTLDEETFTLHEKQPDSDRSLKKPRYELVMK